MMACILHKKLIRGSMPLYFVQLINQPTIPMNYINPAVAVTLLQHIRQVVPLDRAATQAILPNCKEISIAKGDQITDYGKPTRYLYFIVSGKARLYYSNCSGKIITWSFHFNEINSTLNNCFIVDYRRFMPQAPGDMHIEAITDLAAVRIGQRHPSDLAGAHPTIEKCMQKLHEQSFLAAYERIFNLLTQSASDRYSHMLGHEPHLLQMFADKYLASYLGIEPQSLSRIRKNLKSEAVRRNVVQFR